ncbi:hypothetical protein SELMODRAFT_413529 [Selaginella moellendorffii]|uniref:Uncharacterized protein n=1 Tax=Selaginella moellendorffii TaxID=88036 RepID=D8RQK1_SELML|nr:hypothetical protein SELMODRAFT_413529 [Selaginella moellendorffii]
MEKCSASYLAGAVRLLDELFESKQDLKPAAKSFAECHWICLRERDVDGLQWSIRLLQGIINHFTEKELEPDNLYAFLLECFESTADKDEGKQHQESESPRALAEFHVASRHLSATWFISCLDIATSDLLRYHAGMGLGSVIQQQERNGEDCRDALKWFQVSKFIAESLEPAYIEYKAFASYQIAKTLVQLGEIEDAQTLCLEVSTEESVLSAALLDMVNAIIKHKEGEPREEVVAAYAAARRKLVKLMVNVKLKLDEKLGSRCCSQRCILNYTRYRRFAQFYMLMLPKEEKVPGIPLKACLVAYDLYREARLEIVKLQEGWSDAEDARSYVEEGIEVMYQDAAHVSVTAIDSLVLAHQIAVKMDDMDSLWAAGTFLDEYIGRETKGDTPGMISRMVACFRKHSRDDEDQEAWTKYYVGRVGSTDGKVSDEQYEFLKESLERATTPLLSYFVAYALANASYEARTIHEYLERSKKCALQTGKEELIINAMMEQFNSLRENQMFQKAHEIQTEMKKISRAFAYQKLGQAAAEYMEGSLRIAWGEFPRKTSLHFERAINLLESLETPYPFSLKAYLESSHGAGELTYYGRSSVYLISASGVDERHHLQRTISYALD